MNARKFVLTTLFDCLALIKKIAVVTIFLMLFACAQSPKQAENPMMGDWSNNTKGNIVGLKITSETDCELYIERALQARSNRACKYEPYQDLHLIFLVGSDGQCGAEADYEFKFSELEPLIELYVGRTPILLHKE